jgi:hypothetical protein
VVSVLTLNPQPYKPKIQRSDAFSWRASVAEQLFELFEIFSRVCAWGHGTNPSPGHLPATLFERKSGALRKPLLYRLSSLYRQPPRDTSTRIPFPRPSHRWEPEGATITRGCFQALALINAHTAAHAASAASSTSRSFPRFGSCHSYSRVPRAAAPQQQRQRRHYSTTPSASPHAVSSMASTDADSRAFQVVVAATKDEMGIGFGAGSDTASPFQLEYITSRPAVASGP